MAWKTVLFLLVIISLAACQLEDELKTKNKTKTPMAAEKDQKLRSAHPDPDPSKGSFQKLSKILKANGTRKLNRAKVNLAKINELNRDPEHRTENMMNDNEGVLVETNHDAPFDNETYTLTDKMKDLRKEGSGYEANNRNIHIPEVTGVFCDFEATSQNPSMIDMCMWEWNSTLSKHGLGFVVLSALDLKLMNETTTGFKFSGPPMDADEKVDGHFLYLPVDPTMENMVVKSPPFQGLWEFCKFEAYLHQSNMQNASIRLVSESTISQFQWILQETAGNNDEAWQSIHFMIGRVLQEVRIMVEITRPAHINRNMTLPHIAIDNIRMIECLPEPPVYQGQCHKGLLKCFIHGQESCIKPQQICDLVKDCDDGSDENQNCDEMPYGSYCNFESDDCGFVNVPQPILKWSRHYGPTPTLKTGPNYDHTCGPVDPYPTHMIPPLTPTYLNNTVSQCLGYYFFVNMNVTGPNKEKADFASTAIMKSVIFNPPPTVHGNLSSQYYNSCMIRFYYQQNGRNYGSLSVELVELTPRGNISTSLWFSSKDKGENWYRANIFLPNVTRRYFLLFKTRMGMRIYSDSAIDDFSLAPACFGLNIPPSSIPGYNYYEPKLHENTTAHYAFANIPYYRFTPCGAEGSLGPNQTLCDETYEGTDVAVTVVETPPYRGVQMWVVPSEGIYTIIATGGGGGYGSAWAGVSMGNVVRALFTLHKGEVLYILPGQKGTDACRKTLSAKDSPSCARPHSNETSARYVSKTHEVRNTMVKDGGGGGGGGTFIFVLDEVGKPVPLIIAGGGGGLGVGAFRDHGTQHARGLTNTTPDNGIMYGPRGETAGAGGGWQGAFPLEPSGGTPVRRGGGGGVGCAGGPRGSGGAGGFGGGGGGCREGGAAGGYVGGSTNMGNHGGGGFSYISPRALTALQYVTLATHMADGDVLIIPAVSDCGCEYRCVALNEWRSEISCYCPSAWLSQNGTECVLDNTSWVNSSNLVLYLLMAVCAIFVAFIVLVCLFLYNRYQKKREAEKRRKQLCEQEVQLHRLRNPPGGLNAFNPHYGTDASMPPGLNFRDLPELSRDKLKLKKALGQGAFGEVYQGTYVYRPGQEEMPVAVKTLPEMSTTQAEQDFLLEAGIMAKFNHPNIVHLIGVCFDSHPRFIVIELLAGGDLKNFLRDSRPSYGRASSLTMRDLIACSMDVCKGCRYLEAKRFIHRDIASRNCLLTTRSSGRLVKIADFGMARDIYREDYYKKGGKAMLPIKWMPPEAYIDGLFTAKTDIWSFGVLLWEVFSLGVMPYTGCSNREVMDMVSAGGRLESPNSCPQEIYSIMLDCWNPVDSERPTFAHVYDRLNACIQDQEILSIPLPVVKGLLPQNMDELNLANGSARAPPCDYLVPLTPNQDAPEPSSSSEPLIPPSKSPAPSPHHTAESADSQYQPRVKASLGYGNIPPSSREPRDVDERAIKFQQSSSTDRLLSSLEEGSMDDSQSDTDQPTVWETSFSEPSRMDTGPPVDKLISITPTTPNPPENALTKAIATTTDLQIHRTPKKSVKTSTSDSPESKKSWKKESNLPKIDTSIPKLYPKAKPLCLDAAQLEQNLNALKRNSGSVNLKTMNIVPPYINVVTPNKMSDSKTIQIDPKKAVIYDLQSPEEVKDEGKLKQSSSAASLLNGPLTEVPYADSDGSSSSSSGQPPNHIQIIHKSKQNDYSEVQMGKVTRQNSNGEFQNDSEISC